MAASTIFGANIEILTYEKGYFDPDVKQNPLLHSKFKRFTPILLVSFTLGSLIYGLSIVYVNPKFAFYFPICRFWQMSIGGLIAYQNKNIENKLVNHLMSICGTSAILTIVWIID